MVLAPAFDVVPGGVGWDGGLDGAPGGESDDEAASADARP